MSCATTPEPIEIPFGVWTWVGPRKHLLRGGAYWRNLANTIEPSMYWADAAFFYRITLLVLFCVFLASVNLCSCSLSAVARPSVVCLSVMLVHPTQPVEIFGNFSTPFGTVAAGPTRGG